MIWSHAHLDSDLLRRDSFFFCFSAFLDSFDFNFGESGVLSLSREGSSGSLYVPCNGPVFGGGPECSSALPISSDGFGNGKADKLGGTGINAGLGTCGGCVWALGLSIIGGGWTTGCAKPAMSLSTVNGCSVGGTTVFTGIVVSTETSLALGRTEVALAVTAGTLLS